MDTLQKSKAKDVYNTPYSLEKVKIKEFDSNMKQPYNYPLLDKQYMQPLHNTSRKEIYQDDDFGKASISLHSRKRDLKRINTTLSSRPP